MVFYNIITIQIKYQIEEKVEVGKKNIMSDTSNNKCSCDLARRGHASRLYTNFVI